ncbi:MAG: galactokinase [Planctomycetota bacterium]|jgi:galactokinase
MTLEAIRSEAESMCHFILCSEAKAVGMAPACIELLGLPAVYGGGAALTAVVDRYTVVGGRAVEGHTVSVYSDAYERLLQFNAERIERDGTAPWLDYVMGVVDQYRRAGHPVEGFEAAICAELPFGMGLSSSASMVVALAQYLKHIFALSLSLDEVAGLCRGAESEFVGRKASVATAKALLGANAKSLLHFDEDGEQVSSVPFPTEEAAWVLACTGQGTDRYDSAYHQLCQGDWSDASSALATHRAGEAQRIEDCVQAFEAGDLARAGSLLSESHVSCREHLENPTHELELLYHLALETEGCYGTRLAGAGFGGATVNLVARDAVDTFCQAVSSGYEEMSGESPQLIPLELGRAAWTEAV